MSDIARFNCNARCYAWIAMVNYADAMSFAERAFSCEDPEEMIILKQRVENSVAVTITFSAMALESFFYDYGARKTGDSFFKENFDILRPTAKLQLITRFLFNEELEKGEHLYQLVQDLFRLRNAYVHNKSSDARKYAMSEEEMQVFLELDPVYEFPYELERVEIQNKLKEGKLGITTLCEIAKYFDKKDPECYAMFFLLNSGGVGAFDENELRKVQSIQKMLHIPLAR